MAQSGTAQCADCFECCLVVRITVRKRVQIDWCPYKPCNETQLKRRQWWSRAVLSHTHTLITKVKSVGDFFQPITLLRSETRFQKPVIVGTWCQGLSPSLILAFPALNTEQLNKTSSICPSHSLTEPWQWLSGTVKKLRGLSETFLKKWISSGSPSPGLDSRTSGPVSRRFRLQPGGSGPSYSPPSSAVALSLSPPWLLCASSVRFNCDFSCCRRRWSNTMSKRARAARDQSARPVATCQRN